MSRRAERVAKVVKGGLLPIIVAVNGDAWFTVLAAIKIATRAAAVGRSASSPTASLGEVCGLLMRRPIALLALWLTTAIACTTLGWLTVSMVSGPSRESSLRSLIQTTTTPFDVEAGVVQSRPAITPGSTTAMSTSTSPTTTTTTVLGAPQATAADPLPRPAAPTTVPVLPAAPPAPPASTTSITITSRGGSVAVRYDGSTGTVSLLSATPHEGFTINPRDTGPDQVEVHFESYDAESRVFAWWDGEPHRARRGNRLTPRYRTRRPEMARAIINWGVLAGDGRHQVGRARKDAPNVAPERQPAAHQPPRQIGISSLPAGRPRVDARVTADRRPPFNRAASRPE